VPIRPSKGTWPAPNEFDWVWWRWMPSNAAVCWTGVPVEATSLEVEGVKSCLNVQPELAR